MNIRSERQRLHGVFLFWSLMAPLAFCVGGCGSSSSPAGGTLGCATGSNACPDNYYCESSSKTCWPTGTGPDSGARDSNAALSTDVPAGDTRDAGLDPDTRGGAVLDVAPDKTTVIPDAPLGPDSSQNPTPDARLSDGPVDVPVDVPADLPTPDVPVDTTAVLPCNGGCCANADCPATTPVCSAANRCAKCAADQDCTGRSATACNTATGACVQCTKNSQCGGATATCNLATSTCVGCTQRSDCPGACQACSNGSCVQVKSASDASSCAGTCDSNGECKATKGQKCSAVAGGCLGGTTCSADGVCCDRACTGSCEACDVADKLGTCTALTSGGQPHAGHAPCAGTGTCAGTCGGNTDGTCSYSTSTCGAATCSGATYQATGTCSQGTCSMPAATSCKAGATCSGTTCACPSGTTDCTSVCADLSADAKNCGACGHDCLGGTCSFGICQPVLLATVPETRRSRFLHADGGKVYAVTSEEAKLDTSRLWQIDATTPGTPTKILPEFDSYILCVLDGTALYDGGVDSNGNQTYTYCTVNNCSATTQSFTVAGTGAAGRTQLLPPVCDLPNREIVWVMQATSGADQTYSIWRSSIKGANARTITSFLANSGADSSGYPKFAVGRSDRLFFTRTTGTTVKLQFVSTGTQDAAPTVIATGSTGGAIDLAYDPVYANDNLFVWSDPSLSTPYSMPLPSGIGSNPPSQFTISTISGGIMDNKHFYGMFSLLSHMAWCPVASCNNPAVLTDRISSSSTLEVATQDADAIYWTVGTETGGFAVWKVAKQAF